MATTTRGPEVDFTHVPITARKNTSFDCNQLTFVNKGTQPCTIDAIITLMPGDSITYPCFPYEINRHIYSFVFPTNVNGCEVIAICKKYMS